MPVSWHTILTGSDAPLLEHPLYYKSTSTYVWDVWGTLKKKSLVDFHLCYDDWFEIPRLNTMLKLFYYFWNIKTSTAQHGKDWASCLPCHSNSTAWFHDSVRFINNYPISFGQKSWCNLWWSADLQRAHCEDCSILQVCTSQNQKDQALSDRACCTTPCLGPCHF